ncbi:hypothetical protein JNB_19033 [Janibacter sp. HTCC2649]|uniref:HNH endonuclease signature motif containing protein n=1 Tax=Janibacter sp. HTCC2649 TaxID=313589 RepID=UPI0000670ED1|nr:HNH endonuclease signature motif containing protein [Janibacter sp. HTCC2649]EAP97595.1 hypothetical protein JNB_19033 [Janibacter sp. HTCC2649]
MNETPATDIARLRAALEGARDALVSDGSGAGPLGDVLTRLNGPELAEFMALMDDVKARAAAGQIRVTAEASHRGEFTSARRGEGSVHSWVREHAPSLQQDGAGQVAQLAQDVACSVPGGLWSTAGPGVGAYADPEKPEGIVWARVLTGEVGAKLALKVLREAARLEDMLAPEAVPTVAKAMCDFGVAWGAGEVPKLRHELIARFGREGEFDDVQDRLRSGAYLSSPRIQDGDVTAYELALTPEQAAMLEAAIGPLSQPAPNEVTGERDHRPAGQRRAEALAAVCGRVAGEDAAAQDSPGGADTTVHVNMDFDDLLAHFPDHEDTDTAPDLDRETEGSGCGRVMVSRAQATMLSPAIVRQLACDADILPVVFGSNGEILDVGRAVRLFTKAQRRALWHRDKHCTYPGCDVPAGWAKAHHLVHWVDGGDSDLANAALLCQRHHTHVHDKRFIATVHPPDEHGRCVTWDLTPGSYDRDLPARLNRIHRERAKQRATAEQGAAERARLDTGPPDPWANEPPEDVIEAWIDEWTAEEQDRERLEAQREAQIDDALATMLDEERTLGESRANTG